MKLQATYSLTFKGNIIDSHAHIGEWYGNNNYQAGALNNIAQDTIEISIAGQKQKDEIECFLTSNLSSMYKKESGKFVKDETDGNKEILEIAAQNPKIKPELVCEPSQGSADKIDALLKEHSANVYALKFHPMCSALDANDAKYEPYLRVAQKYKKPCVFHSDKIDTAASPYKIYELAKKTPEVPVVLYHMSMASSVDKFAPFSHLAQEEISAKGIDNVDKINEFQWNNRERWNQDGIDVVKEALAKKDANLYLETSWTKPETVVNAIKEVGEDRVLFGTDAPFDGKEKYIQYVSDVKTAIKKEFGERAESITNKVFFENANKLFFDGKLKQAGNGVVNLGATPPGKTGGEITPPVKSNKKLWWIFGGLAALLAGAAFLMKSNKDSSPKS